MSVMISSLNDLGAESVEDNAGAIRSMVALFPPLPPRLDLLYNVVGKLRQLAGQVYWNKKVDSGSRGQVKRLMDTLDSLGKQAGTSAGSRPASASSYTQLVQDVRVMLEEANRLRLEIQPVIRLPQDLLENMRSGSGTASPYELLDPRKGGTKAGTGAGTPPPKFVHPMDLGPIGKDELELPVIGRVKKRSLVIAGGAALLWVASLISLRSPPEPEMVVEDQQRPLQGLRRRKSRRRRSHGSCGCSGS